MLELQLIIIFIIRRIYPSFSQWNVWKNKTMAVTISQSPSLFCTTHMFKKKKQTAGTRKCLVGFALIKKVIHLIFELFL